MAENGLLSEDRPLVSHKDTRVLPKKKEVSPLVQLAGQREWNLQRLAKLVSSGRPAFDFTTTGSSGKSPETLLNLLSLPVFKTSLVVDIRANPSSQHTPLWNKSSVQVMVKGRGLDYIHRPDLGVPREIRNQLVQGLMSYPAFFEWYDTNVATEAAIGGLRELIPRHPLFLCTELGLTYCHRHRLALAMEKRFDLISFDV